MIRYCQIFILFSFSLVSFGQEFEFKKPKNIRIEFTLLDTYYKDSAVLGDTISISCFNKNGEKAKTINKSKGLIESISEFKYDNSGHIIEYKDYGRRSYHTSIDPLTGRMVETSIWDSTTVILIRKYLYEKELLKRIDEYSFGFILEFSTIYDYDSMDRVIKELSISYPNENTLVYFKPNSSEIDWNHPQQTKIETYTRQCTYPSDKRICVFSDSSGIKSSDTSTYSNGFIFSSIAYDTNDRLLYEKKYEYNDDKQLKEYYDVSSGIGYYGGEYDQCK